MNNPQTDIQDDEIDLLELIKVLWDERLKIVAITIISAFISVIYALSQPNIYKADALLAAASEERDGISNITSQFAGLASLAASPLNSGDYKTDLALEVLKSKKFVREFVKRHNIVPQLMAVDYWNPKTRELMLNANIYDEKAKAWLEKDGHPTNQQIYETYIRQLIIEEDPGSEFVRVGFKHKSPDIASEWTGLIVKDLNNAIRRQDISEAESSIAYLRKQIETSPLTELRNLFYNLIQSQTETMMLANVREEYVFKTIDPATVPEYKSEPKRAFISIVGTFLGILFSVIVVLCDHYFRKSEKI